MEKDEDLDIPQEQDEEDIKKEKDKATDELEGNYNPEEKRYFIQR